MKEDNFKTVLIYGVGLIGGSIGLRIKEKNKNMNVLGFSRKMESLKIAKKIKAVDDYSLNKNELVKKADLIIFCVPPLKVFPFLKDIFAHLKDRVVITDVSSVKGREYSKIESFIKNNNKKYKKNISYIGSHPMAGSEKKGVKNALAEILDDAMVFITPLKESLKKDISSLKQFWENLGCRTNVLSPELHDKYVAYTSHFPHILAGVLVDTVWTKARQNKNMKFAIAKSFKGITRISDSDPYLWTEISIINRNNILNAINDYKNKLNKIEKYLKTGSHKELTKYFENNKISRAKLVGKNEKLYC